MKSMLTSKLVKSALISMVLIGAPGAGTAFAQETLPSQPPQAAPASPEVSDSQIDSFVSAYQSIQQVQSQAQQEMIAALEAEGLTVEEFQMIAQAQQSPEPSSSVSPEQAEQLAAAAEQISAIEASAQEDIQLAIQAEGLTPEEFNQILALVQQDPALQEKINQQLAQ
ncbi:MAG: DUF4168 domain-containing protein [Leptolyngbya sp. DLM2.Bin15]|nr:MAG: DUF4168 domain-containing protein [Leptolyngbya sp. DLM2.Bin15]